MDLAKNSNLQRKIKGTERAVKNLAGLGSSGLQKRSQKWSIRFETGNKVVIACHHQAQKVNTFPTLRLMTTMCILRAIYVQQ